MMMSNSFFKPNRLWLGRWQRVVMRLSLAMVACFIAFSTVQAQSTVTFKGGGQMYYEDTGWTDFKLYEYVL